MNVHLRVNKCHSHQIIAIFEIPDVNLLILTKQTEILAWHPYEVLYTVTYRDATEHVEISEIFPILFRAMKLQMNMTCHFFFKEWDRWRPTYLLSYGAYKVTIDLSQCTHWTFLFLTVQHLKTNRKRNSEQITMSTASVVTFLVGCVNDPRLAKMWLDELQFYF